MAPAPRPALTAAAECDLAIVGAGFTGLWAALQAKERDLGADVVAPDAGRIGGQASGRNVGICMASLTHGVARGAELFPSEEARLIALGMESLDAIEQSIGWHGIDCGWERTGELDIAGAARQFEGLREERGHYARVGLGHDWLDREALRAEIHSPTYEAGLWRHDAAILDPARLAWGLARVCAGLGVRSHERRPVTALARAASGVELRTPWGALRALAESLRLVNGAPAACTAAGRAPRDDPHQLRPLGLPAGAGRPAGDSRPSRHPRGSERPSAQVRGPRCRFAVHGRNARVRAGRPGGGSVEPVGHGGSRSIGGGS